MIDISQYVVAIIGIYTEVHVRINIIQNIKVSVSEGLICETACV